MKYDRGDSFPFNFETYGILFGLDTTEKLSPDSYITFNLKGYNKFGMGT